ncbi:unnamed protein product [Ambrosiozyma monospora]|uniref:Unnamed protein product n=1 Tax=Ambrosiozyma monospora TaxID=43982 RepID=A0ACB5TQ48_AMBMO|nr:unnamed protein product [Ambrosiozyma monospora]
MMKKFKNFFTFLFSGDDDADTIKAGQIAYDCAMKYLKELSGGDGSYALVNDDENMLLSIPEVSAVGGIVDYSLGKAFFCMLLKKYTVIYKLLEDHVLPILESTGGSLQTFWANFYLGLSLIKCPDKLPDQQEKLTTVLADLKSLVSINPSLCEPKYLYLLALFSIREEDSEIDTLDLFEAAAESALRYGSTFDSAIISEECGYWLKANSKSKTRSQKYFTEALKYYEIWGCRFKAEQMKDMLGSFTLISYSQLAANNNNSPNSPRGSFEKLSDDSRSVSSSVITATPGASSFIGSTPVFSKAFKSLGVSVSTPSTPNIPNTPNTPKLTPPLISHMKPFSFTGESDIYSSPDSGEGTSTVASASHHNHHLVSEEVEAELEAEVEAEVEMEEEQQNLTMKRSASLSELNDRNSIVKELLEGALEILQGQYGCIVLLDDSDIPFVEAVGTPSDGVELLQHEMLRFRGDICPISLICDCIKDSSYINRESDPVTFDERYPNDDYYFESNSTHAVVYVVYQEKS